MVIEDFLKRLEKTSGEKYFRPSVTSLAHTIVFLKHTPTPHPGHGVSSVTKKRLFSLRMMQCNCEVRGHCKCKEMPVIPVDTVADKKRITGKNGRPRRTETQGDSDSPPLADQL
jgi:hypothetical protein